MKKSVVITIVLLAVLIAGGCFTLFTFDSTADEKESLVHIEKAEDLMSRKLYQLASMEYQEAIGLYDTEETEAKLLDTYELLYAENNNTLDSYITAAEHASGAFPANADFAMTLAKCKVRADDWQGAYRGLERSIGNGLEGEEAIALLDTIKYSYDIGWNTYDDYTPLSGGFYAVKKEEGWICIDEEGSERDGDLYDYLSPCGENGLCIMSSEGTSVMVDEDDVMQGRLSYVPVNARSFSEGAAAVDAGNGYYFIDTLGDKIISGPFEDAGCFTGGKAPVMIGGKWYFIDEQGNKIEGVQYDGILIEPSGEWLKNGVFWAKNGSKWTMYNSEHAPVIEFSAEEIGGLGDGTVFAYKQNGLWGYISSLGEVMSEPVFEDARSFSNDLGAIFSDGLWGYTDKTMKPVIPCQFNGAGYFSDKHFAMVKVNETQWQFLSLKVSF